MAARVSGHIRYVARVEVDDQRFGGEKEAVDMTNKRVMLTQCD